MDWRSILPAGVRRCERLREAREAVQLNYAGFGNAGIATLIFACRARIAYGCRRLKIRLTLLCRFRPTTEYPKEIFSCRTSLIFCRDWARKPSCPVAPAPSWR